MPQISQFAKYRLMRDILLPLCISLQITAEIAGAAAPIDNSVVLKIGPLEVSQYVVTKRFIPFRENLQSENGDTSKEISSWFEDFLVNQVLTAEAISEGYAAHPDVIALVDRMERHMLCATYGPYYKHLMADMVRPEVEIMKLYEESSEKTVPVPYEDYRRMIQTQDTEKAVEIHRKTILETAQFRIEPKNCATVLEHLVDLPPSPADIPSGFLENVSNLPLASYIRDGEPQAVSIREWIEYFSALFIRSIPTSNTDLERSIEDVVVAEADIRAARALGIDQEPQFVEDRKHFLNAQALDRFEREKLLPNITLSEGEIETYYQQHQEMFRQPISAGGMLLRFQDQETAMRWLQSYRLDERNDALATSVEEVEVTAEHPIPALKPLTRPILWSQEGQPIGPVPIEDSIVIFLKQSSVTKPTPLSEVAGYITEQLKRAHLHDLEKTLAPQYCQAFVIEDNIPYEDYGAHAVKTPWRDQE